MNLGMLERSCENFLMFRLLVTKIRRARLVPKAIPRGHDRRSLFRYRSNGLLIKRK